MKTVAQQIADWLVRQGIEKVFAVTGGGAMFLNQALGGCERLSCTFMHHEQACAMAAEGYARIAGKPAVVMLTTGPGPMNALNGVYGAYTDSIPMLVISGQVKRETCLAFVDQPELRQLGDQEGPTIAVATPVCKYARIVRRPREIEELLPTALQTALSGRPGPVWLDIPLDIQSSVEQLSIPDLTPEPARAVSDQLRGQCRHILDRLKAADRPLILGGTGIRLAGAVERVLAFVERAGVPMATAWTHDIIASDHPLFAGRPGTIGTRAGNLCLQNADFVLVLGSRLNIRQISYNWQSFARDAWVAQVDIDPAELAKPTFKPDFPVAADINDFFNALNDLVGDVRLPDYSAWATWCREIGKSHALTGEHRQVPCGPLNPYLVVDRIFKQLRDDDIVACGNASACILPFQIGALKAGQRLFSNSGSASMGYDLPSALGAAAAAAQCQTFARVICFAGDGSLQMNIQELQTLKTCGSNVIVIVLNNAGYLSIRQTHENFFGRVIGATPGSGVEFPDYCAVARAYGLRAARVESESDLAELDRLLRDDGPLLIDVIVDPRQEFSPRIKSRVDENGGFVTPELDDMHPFLNQDVLDDIRESARAVRAERGAT